MRVDIPWPPRELSPNAREDRRAIAPIRAKYRADCGWAARAAGLRKIPDGPLHFDITFRPPDRRPRDLDNLLSSIKNGLDGIADVIRVDDSWWSYTIRKAEAVPGGMVSIQIGRECSVIVIPMKGQIE